MTDLSRIRSLIVGELERRQDGETSETPLYSALSTPELRRLLRVLREAEIDELYKRALQAWRLEP